MNKSQILKKIGNIIEELSEQQQYLAETSNISPLELELFTANADFLIDHIGILKRFSQMPLEIKGHEPARMEAAPMESAPVELAKHIPLLKNIEIKSVSETEKPIAVEPEIEEEEEPKRTFNFSFDEEPAEMIFDFERKIAVEEVFDRPLSDDEKKVIEEKSAEAPVAEDESLLVIEEKQNEEEEDEDNLEFEEPFLFTREDAEPELSLANLKNDKKQQVQDIPISPVEVAIKAEKPLTLNEMLSEKLSQNAGNNRNKPATKKLDDLKTAISINDKMVFIKELFNGYNLAYSEAIEILNRFESFDSADNFLQRNYSVKNDWENKQATVDRFYEYLNKKFIM